MDHQSPVSFHFARARSWRSKLNAADPTQRTCLTCSNHARVVPIRRSSAPAQRRSTPLLRDKPTACISCNVYPPIAKSNGQRANRHPSRIFLLSNVLSNANVTVDAVYQWRTEGIPDSPRAWIIQTAKHKAIDRLRRQTRLQEKLAADPDFASEPIVEGPSLNFDEIPDDRLRLIFTCCHPALSLEAQVALTLRTLGGLQTDE